MNPLSVILAIGLYEGIRSASQELPKIAEANKAIAAMPEITQEQQAVKHAAIIAERERQTGGSDWRNRGVGYTRK